MTRELSPKGLRDRKLVTAFLMDKKVDAVLSSPYKRAVDTVAEFARSRNLPVTTLWDFRERKVESAWIEDFDGFCRRQWADFDYRRSDGETLREVQDRNIRALKGVLDGHRDETLVIGSHGTALSTVINHYDPSFGYDAFFRIRDLMPWVVRFTFEGRNCWEIRQFDLFALPNQEKIP